MACSRLRKELTRRKIKQTKSLSIVGNCWNPWIFGQSRYVGPWPWYTTDTTPPPTRARWRCLVSCILDYEDFNKGKTCKTWLRKCYNVVPLDLLCKLGHAYWLSTYQATSDTNPMDLRYNSWAYWISGAKISSWMN